MCLGPRPARRPLPCAAPHVLHAAFTRILCFAVGDGRAGAAGSSPRTPQGLPRFAHRRSPHIPVGWLNARGELEPRAREQPLTQQGRSEGHGGESMAGWVAGVPGWAGAEDAAGWPGVASPVRSRLPRVSVEDQAPAGVLRLPLLQGSLPGLRLPRLVPPSAFQHCSSYQPPVREQHGKLLEPHGLHPGVRIRAPWTTCDECLAGTPACRQRPVWCPQSLGSHFSSGWALRQLRRGRPDPPRGGPRAPGLAGRPQRMRMPQVPWGGPGPGPNLGHVPLPAR